MEEDKPSLLQPFIPHYSTLSSSHSHHHHNLKNITSDTNNNIIGILAILSLALISIWANYEASKAFNISIVNDAKDSPAGRRFALSYVSNDRATRIILNTSSYVEHFLYPNNNVYPKKHIDKVTLRLPKRNLNATVAVYAAGNLHHGGGKSSNSYVIEITPMLLADKGYDKMAIVGAILRGMARVWMWDGAPQGLADGIVEYVAEMAGFRCEVVADRGKMLECEEPSGGGWWWEGKDPTRVARLLRYCEKYKMGFIQRLNEAMRDTWRDQMVDEVLGMPFMEVFCGHLNKK
ncbi:unnamed protein product [Sphenostylis stenocarpa]|uniref:Uncharacterized protein n=1 Tax=Sphenostylis stenocarpa TaxID=92480 RepID=A0AA86VKY4_9FABA|nr:unnamed protein product [Sphenostylis stenocarpa]